MGRWSKDRRPFHTKLTSDCHLFFVDEIRKVVYLDCMKYERYEYLWPPRPDSKRAVPPTGAMGLSFYERRGWFAQIKKNGTCNVIAVSPEGELVTMNRHRETHKLWNPTPASSAAFQKLPGKGWYVFVAELLHSKVTNGPRDTNYIFDVLVADGEYLVGKTFLERQAILADIFPKSKSETASHRVIDSNTWVAKLIKSDFEGVFEGLSSAEDEGLVIKNPMAKLELCSRQAANTAWQVKCRKTHKNFSF
jgi:hypothetical protein